MNTMLERKHINLKQHGAAKDLILGVLERGEAVCTRSARSELGASYVSGNRYRYELRTINDRRYYRVFPGATSMAYELVNLEQFEIYFRAVPK